ncbi:MAG TPA: hypothetical protein DDZ69_05125 [Porphyromonadaceae bacterium]|jgi:hypothetical protein|nr:hypothetical protein [Porphyromonadaceae bacterium]HBU46493.1 hypothetical protein [Porphyromonadaceae bacterium]HMM17686.1 hypothetical protein [Petrimonas sp.]
METKINKLSEIEKRNPFTVPEDYFSRLNEHIMNFLPEKEIIKPKKVSMWDKAKPWVYMAAMFMGIFFTIQLLTRNTTNQVAAIPSTQFTDDYWSTVQITEEEFYQYLEEQLVNDGYYDYMYNQVYMN